MSFLPRHKNVNLTCLNDLPNELLLDIFAFCSLHHINYEQWYCEQNSKLESTLRLLATPWCLTRVSHRWRSLATHTPWLWTELVFPAEEGGYVHEDMVQTYLERSMDYPLSLHIPTRLPSHLFHSLYEHAHRWKYIFIGYKDWTYRGPLTTFHLLQYLRCDGSIVSQYFPPITQQFFPQLRSVSSNEDCRDIEIPQMVVSDDLLHQIDHLAVMNAYQAALLSVLQRSAPFLSSLELASIYEPSGEPTLKDLTLPVLRRINTQLDVPERVVQTLECPVLEEMTLSCSTQRLQMMDPWISMIARSGCHRTITSLTLLNFQWFGDELFELLGLTTNLQHFHLSFLKSQSRSLREEYKTEQLLAKFSDEDLCPSLNRFTLIDWNDKRVLHETVAFTRLIRARGRRILSARLSVLNGRYSQESQGLVCNQLEALVRLRDKLGIDLHIERWYFQMPDTMTPATTSVRRHGAEKAKSWLGRGRDRPPSPFWTQPSTPAGTHDDRRLVSIKM